MSLWKDFRAFAARGDVPESPAARPTLESRSELLENLPVSTRRRGAFTTVLLAVMVAATPALAQTPVHDEPKPPTVDQPAEWSAALKASFMLSAGNARSLSASATPQLGYKWLGNKLSFEGGLAYARSEVRLAFDDDPPGAPGAGTLEPGEIDSLVQTTTQLWTVQGRYDRFFAAQDSAFLTGRLLSDEPAGKELLATVQAGYSRQLVKSERHEALAELGYDFTSEKLTAADGAIPIHSARALLGYSFKVNTTTGATMRVEGLFNLNEERAPNVRGGNVIGPLGDFRINVRAGLNFAFTENLSFGVGATARYDHAPAPLTPLPVPFAPGYVPFADPLDLQGEAQLQYTFL